MHIDEIIANRRSIRKYTQIPVDKNLWGQIVVAGTHAPSCGNLQNWKVIVITNPQTKKKIVQAAFHQVWIEQAPVIIVICSDDKLVHQFYGTRGQRLYAVQNTAAMAQNMLLKATELGLGSCWISAFDEERLKVALSIPSNIRPQSIITIGYADETVPAPTLRDPHDFLFFETYGNRLSPNMKDITYRQFGKMHKRAAQSVFQKIKDIFQRFFK